MINLIPNEQKKLMIRGFYLRLLTVLFLSLGFCMLIACVVLFPAYLLSSSKDSLVSQKLQNEKSAPVDAGDKETVANLTDLDTKLSLIEKAEKNKFLVSKRVVDQIATKKFSNIRINEISFSTLEKGGTQVGLRGVASSRESLLLFRKSLEENSLFQKVDLPISNFIKGSNIQFYLSLIPS